MKQIGTCYTNYMNEHDARKIGEVLAFTRVGLDTLQRGEGALESVFEQEFLDTCFDTTEQLLEEFERFMDHNQWTNSIETKVEATADKLVHMRDLYLQDEWEDPTEILEWLGFFEGAAVVHWGLVQGIAERIGDSSLESMAEEAVEFHQNVLSTSRNLLRSTGRQG